MESKKTKAGRILQLVFSFLGAGKLKKYRLITIKVLNVIKDVIENPVADIVVQWSKSDLDDEALAWTRKEIPKILKDLELTQRINLVGTIADTARYIRQVEPEDRGAYYKRIAGELYNTKAKLPIDIAIEEVQREYKATSSEAPLT